MALQLFRFTVTHITGEEGIVAYKLSRIPRPMATPNVLEIIQLAGELELASDAEEESDSYSKE